MLSDDTMAIIKQVWYDVIVCVKLEQLSYIQCKHNHLVFSSCTKFTSMHLMTTCYFKVRRWLFHSLFTLERYLHILHVLWYQFSSAIFVSYTFLREILNSVTGRVFSILCMTAKEWWDVIVVLCKGRRY